MNIRRTLFVFLYFNNQIIKNMFNVNEYFDGKVKSLGFENKKGAARIGVIAAGE